MNRAFYSVISIAAVILGCVSTTAFAQRSPIVVRLRMGMSSDVAIEIIGSGPVRDTVREKYQADRIRFTPVVQFGIVGELELDVCHGSVCGLKWTGHIDPTQPAHGDAAQITAEVRDSLSERLGAPSFERDGTWNWSSKDGVSYQLEHSDAGVVLTKRMDVTIERPPSRARMSP